MISPNWDEGEDPIASEREENPLSSFWMEGDSCAPPCQSEMDVVTAILDLIAPLTAHDHLYDLGCGDGRIPIEAALRFGCRSTGVEIEEKLIALFKKRIEMMRVSENVSALCADLRETDLSTATHIVLYLLPDAVEGIKTELSTAVTRGAKLVCNTWGPKGWKHVTKISCGFCNNVSIYLYDRTSLPDYTSLPASCSSTR